MGLGGHHRIPGELGSFLTAGAPWAGSSSSSLVTVTLAGPTCSGLSKVQRSVQPPCGGQQCPLGAKPQATAAVASSSTRGEDGQTDRQTKLLS